MKKQIRFIYLGMLMIYTSLSFSQVTTLGPYDAYVSKQMPGNTVIYEGTYPASADEGRYIRLNIYNIVGPIQINHTMFDLDGPACPTYTETGKRVPENPLPSNVQVFGGQVISTEAPEPGITADASFESKEDGFWTTCSTGEKHYFNQLYHVNFKIHSLKLVLDAEEIYIGKDMNIAIGVTERYPASGGDLTFTSANGKVQVNNSAGGCNITYIESGIDYVIATLTLGNVVYKDTVIVNAVELAFTKSIYNYLSPVDEEIAATSLLTATSEKVKLDWTYKYNGGAETVWNPATFNKKNFAAGDVLEMIAKVKGAPAITASATARFYNLDLAFASLTACDGKELPFTITIRPFNAGVAAELLPTVANMTPKYTLAAASFGNPKGNTNLTFGAINASYQTKIENMIWYATAAEECNDMSIYKIKVEGKVNGKDIVSWEYNVGADINATTCCNGSAGPTQTFTGLPNIITKQDEEGKWYGWIDAIGSFARTVKCTTTNICPPNSQYRAMIQAEEDYHVGQMEMTNGSVACADQWVVNNVFNGIMTKKWYSVSGDQNASRALAWHVFITRRNSEDARSWAQFAYPTATRCFMESEAKAKTGASFRFKMKCAYPDCK